MISQVPISSYLFPSWEIASLLLLPSFPSFPSLLYPPVLTHSYLSSCEAALQIHIVLSSSCSLNFFNDFCTFERSGFRKRGAPVGGLAPILNPPVFLLRRSRDIHNSLHFHVMQWRIQDFGSDGSRRKKYIHKISHYRFYVFSYNLSINQSIIFFNPSRLTEFYNR